MSTILDTGIHIDSELQAWIDPLSAEEYAQLEASILQEGCRDPLVIRNGYLLDGHNRYDICIRHKIPFQTFEKTGLVNQAAAKIWMIENQLGKRNTSDFSRVALVLKVKPLYAERAKERQIANQPTSGQQVGQARQNSDAPKERTDDLLAKIAGVSRDTVRKVELIEEKASDEIKGKVRSGEISINAAAKTVMPPKLEKEPVTFENSGEVTIPDGMVLVDSDNYNQLQSDNKHSFDDNVIMSRVFDSDDRVKASMAEAMRQKAIADVSDNQYNAQQGKLVALTGQVTYWKNRADKAEKALSKYEVSK